MAQKIVAGNWKMNLDLEQSLQLIEGLNTKEFKNDVRVIVFPPSLFLQPISAVCDGSFELGVQNFSENEKGAFTGEISINQIESVGGTVGLIGHSERRAYNGESNELLKAKVNHCIENNFDFIFCCGEPLSVREAGNELSFVKKQLEASLFHLTADQIAGGVIAYEPVWAIGTGNTASKKDIEEVHKFIKNCLNDYFENLIKIPVIYGGSVNAKNSFKILKLKIKCQKKSNFDTINFNSS